MKNFILVPLVMFVFQGVAQVQLAPLHLTSLENDSTTFSQNISVKLTIPTLSNKKSKLSITQPEFGDIGFGFSKDQPLNRNLGFNNEIPTWIKYDSKNSPNYFNVDRPAYRADEHGIMPSTIQRFYLEAEDLQREPIPKKISPQL
jgi:hypothetical protein